MAKPRTKLQHPPTAPLPAPVTTTRLQVVTCARCPNRLPYHPGKAGEVLTEHYNSKHLAELTTEQALSR